MPVRISSPFGKHDFHSADGGEMVVQRAAAAAAFERVTDRAAPSGIGRIDPHLEFVLLNVAVEIEVADARLDQREVILCR